MFAVFQFLGKQYKVTVGDHLKLPKQDCKKGDVINFDNVVFFKDETNQLIIGSPSVENTVVKAKVIDLIRYKKIIVFKKKRRHNYRRKMGHRQDLTLVKITEITSSNKKKIPFNEKKDVQKNSEKIGDNNGS